jgi:AcrR family transcriptional regulator
MSNKTAADADATRRSLIRAGSRLFSKRGFDDVAAEEIVAAAKVTRGALYHHFEGGKPGLFRAVVSQAMREVHARLTAAGAGATSPLKAFESGARAFLEACAEPGFQRILLIDAPRVLGWHDWRAMDLELGLGLLRRCLDAAVHFKQLQIPDVEMATHLIAGALIDGAMLLGKDPTDAALRRRIETTLFKLVNGFAPPAPKRQG